MRLECVCLLQKIASKKKERKKERNTVGMLLNRRVYRVVKRDLAAVRQRCTSVYKRLRQRLMGGCSSDVGHRNTGMDEMMVGERWLGDGRRRRRRRER